MSLTLPPPASTPGGHASCANLGPGPVAKHPDPRLAQRPARTYHFPGLFYAPSRLLLTVVGVRLAVGRVSRANPRLHPLHFPGAVVLACLSASA
jgi:hypothetical protein